MGGLQKPTGPGLERPVYGFTDGTILLCIFDRKILISEKKDTSFQVRSYLVLFFSHCTIAYSQGSSSSRRTNTSSEKHVRRNGVSTTKTRNKGLKIALGLVPGPRAAN